MVNQVYFCLQFSPGRVYTQCNSLRGLLGMAYQITWSTPLHGMPAWGRAPCGDRTENTFTITATMPATTTPEQAREMMQNLLATRFHLRVHWETKLGKVLALEVAPGGKPRLWNRKTDDKPIPPHSLGCPTEDPHCTIICCGGGTMADLANLLGPIGGLPVIDQTGLSGDYDTTLKYAGDFAPDSPLPSRAAALRQKGLILRPEIGPIPNLYIDHVEKPSPN